jgi:hypothetical protein
MAFTPKEPLNIAAVGGDGKQTGFTKIKNEFAWLYGTILSGLFSSTTGHKHTGAVNDSPQIGTSGIEDESITTEKLATDIVSPTATVATFAKGVPIGFIGIWSGSVANIANIDSRYGTWKICDGTNGTVDLRDKFIVGAGNGYVVGATGGENFHELSIAEMPSHNHINSIYANLLRPPYVGSITGSDTSGSGSEQAVGAGDSQQMLSVGGGNGHENRPPYYALCYIQRTA